MNPLDPEHRAQGLFEDFLHYMPSGDLLLMPTPEVFQKVREVQLGWEKLEAKMASDPKIAHNLKTLHDHWVEFFQTWKTRIASNDWRDYRGPEVDAIVNEFGSANRYLPGQATAPNPIANTTGTGSLLQSVGQKTDDATKGGLTGYLTDPKRMYPGGPIDPSKAPPDANCDPCKKLMPELVCKATGACPGGVSLGDIPWWVWAIGGAGVAGFGALTYASFKAAPYVLSVIPETAPIGMAWQQARAADVRRF